MFDTAHYSSGYSFVFVIIQIFFSHQISKLPLLHISSLVNETCAWAAMSRQESWGSTICIMWRAAEWLIRTRWRKMHMKEQRETYSASLPRRDQRSCSLHHQAVEVRTAREEEMNSWSELNHSGQCWLKECQTLSQLGLRGGCKKFASSWIMAQITELYCGNCS